MLGLFANLFRKTYIDKNENQKIGVKVKKLIETDGVEYASKRFAEVGCELVLKTKNFAYQFVLEEMEAASIAVSISNNKLLKSLLDNGISSSEYIGAILNSTLDNDDDFFKAQLFFISLSDQLDGDLKIEFKMRVVNEVIKFFHMGKQ